MTLPQKWHIVNFARERVEEIQKKYDFSINFSKVLLEKGIETEKKIKRLLSPGIEHLHPSSLLPDIEVGFERVSKAIKKQEKIFIWGDEDTDGITATVFLFELLSNLNADVSYHIPNRKIEGIGLNIPGIKKARKMGCSLIITVDCSSSDYEKISEAQKMGIDIIVTDHHEVLTDGNKDFPLINPKRTDSSYPFREIAGVTVAFKFGWFIAERLLSLNCKEWESIMKDWYPLIFLGTYADRVPLKDENWILSRLGFKSFSETKRLGIRILTEMICKNQYCDEGMIHRMISVFSAAKTKGWEDNIGFRIFTENNENYLTQTITHLIAESEDWHSLANENFRRILASINENTKQRIIFVYEPKTSYIYLGFCASRLKERFNRPVIVMSDRDNYIIGEARAPQGFNIHKLLSEQRPLFLSFGGHKPACGFTIKRENLDTLKKSLVQNCPEIISEDEKRNEMRILNVLPIEKITKKIKDEILLLSPFGQGNPPPLFLAQNVPLSKGVYTYEIPETGESKRIEIKSDCQTWVGIDGKPVILDIVYYINNAGVPTIADARPSIFNE